uniref:C-C motif chemokine n=1 Tax=Rhinolophus ferrumequinum TaxID=59479 RepID=A0A671E4D3_RHIFE
IKVNDFTLAFKVQSLSKVSASYSPLYLTELADNMPRCCYSYISRTIPLRVVTGYERTGSHCSLQGVMFLTKSGRKLCANPSNSWVQRHIRHLDQKSK